MAAPVAHAERVRPPWLVALIGAPLAAFLITWLLALAFTPQFEALFSWEIDGAQGRVGLALAMLGSLTAPVWTAIACRRRGVPASQAVPVVALNVAVTGLAFVFAPLLLWALSCNLSGTRCT